MMDYKVWTRLVHEDIKMGQARKILEVWVCSSIFATFPLARKLRGESAGSYLSSLALGGVGVWNSLAVSTVGIVACEVIPNGNLMGPP